MRAATGSSPMSVLPQGYPFKNLHIRSVLKVAQSLSFLWHMARQCEQCNPNPSTGTQDIFDYTRMLHTVVQFNILYGTVPSTHEALVSSRYDFNKIFN